MINDNDDDDEAAAADDDADDDDCVTAARSISQDVDATSVKSVTLGFRAVVNVIVTLTVSLKTFVTRRQESASARYCACCLAVFLSLYSRQRESREYSDHPRLSVCLSVCLHDKTKTAETTITKLATRIVHHESLPTN